MSRRSGGRGLSSDRAEWTLLPIRRLITLSELGSLRRVRNEAETKQLADCDAYERERRQLESPTAVGTA